MELSRSTQRRAVGRFDSFRLIASLLFAVLVLLCVAARAMAAPGNDYFTNRTQITGLTNTITATNEGATKETGEPNHAANSGGKSVWWTWTAPTNLTATLDTLGSSFDTLLAVYVGSSVSNLTLVAGDDDAGGNGTSRLTFPAVAGTMYQIAVDGFLGDFGTV